MGAGASSQSPSDDFVKAWEDGSVDKEFLRTELHKCNMYVKHKNMENSVHAIPENITSDQEQLDKLWKLCDYNNNNMTSLAELDKMIVDNFPAFDNKPALMRAYTACDLNRNGFISRSEFQNFFGYLTYFTKLWQKFEHIDSDGDRRIDFTEMRTHAREIFGHELNDREAAILFNTLDRNHGGQILFYEFCAYMAKVDRMNFTVDKLIFE